MVPRSALPRRGTWPDRAGNYVRGARGGGGGGRVGRANWCRWATEPTSHSRLDPHSYRPARYAGPGITKLGCGCVRDQAL